MEIKLPIQYSSILQTFTKFATYNSFNDASCVFIDLRDDDMHVMEFKTGDSSPPF